MGVLKKLLLGIAIQVLGAFLIMWLTGDPKLARQGKLEEWLQSVPLWAWGLIGAITLMIIVSRVTIWWTNKSSNRDYPVAIGSVTPGWNRNEERAAKVEYAGAIWDVMLDMGSLSNRTNPNDPAPDKIRVPPEPKCTKCGTGLVEKEGWWNKYVWTCPKCGRSTSSSDSKFAVAKEAEKVAISDWPRD